MNIELGPAASYLARRQATTHVSNNIDQWIEYLIVTHAKRCHQEVQDKGSDGADPRREDVLEALLRSLDGLDEESTVYVKDIKVRLDEVAPNVAVTQVGNWLDWLGVERHTDRNGGHYNVGEVFEAIIAATKL